MSEEVATPLPAPPADLLVPDPENEAVVEAKAIARDVLARSTADLGSFMELLDSITTIDPRLKLLWKQIYENALTDRRNAYLVWTDLYVLVANNPEQHVIHGDHMAKYLERMEKSNTQLLKLAELVHRAKEKQAEDEVPTASELFLRLRK